MIQMNTPQPHTHTSNIRTGYSGPAAGSDEVIPLPRRTSNTAISRVNPLHRRQVSSGHSRDSSVETVRSVEDPTKNAGYQLGRKGSVLQYKASVKRVNSSAGDGAKRYRDVSTGSEHAYPPQNPEDRELEDTRRITENLATWSRAEKERKRLQVPSLPNISLDIFDRPLRTISEESTLEGSITRRLSLSKTNSPSPKRDRRKRRQESIQLGNENDNAEFFEEDEAAEEYKSQGQHYTDNAAPNRNSSLNEDRESTLVGHSATRPSQSSNKYKPAAAFTQNRDQSVSPQHAEIDDSDSSFLTWLLCGCRINNSDTEEQVGRTNPME